MLEAYGSLACHNRVLCGSSRESRSHVNRTFEWMQRASLSDELTTLTLKQNPFPYGF